MLHSALLITGFVILLIVKAIQLDVYGWPKSSAVPPIRRLVKAPKPKLPRIARPRKFRPPARKAPRSTPVNTEVVELVSHFLAPISSATEIQLESDYEITS